MRGRTLVLLLLCIFVSATTAALLGRVFGVPLRVSQVVGGVLAAAAFLYLDRGAPRRPAPRLPTEPYVSPFEVRFDDVAVTVSREGKPDARVDWADLLTVGVRIDDSFLPEPWWLLFGGERTGVWYPGSARGAREMLAELQRRLPGFDNEGVIQAMGMMSGGVVLWTRTPAASPRS